MLLDLTHNVALLVALAVVLQTLAYRFEARTWGFKALSGILFGLVGIVGMSTPLTFAPGVIYDGRSIALSLAGLFGGPLTAGLAAAMSVAYRILGVGGAGAWVGTLVIVQATLSGVVLHYLRRRSEIWVSPARLLAFGFVVHVLVMLIQLLLPGGVGWQVVRSVGPIMILGFPVGFALIAHIFLEGEKRRQARNALAESAARYRSLFENNHAVMLLIDPADGSIVDANPAAVHFYGWDLPTLRRMRVDEINTMSRDETVREMESARRARRNYFLFQHRLADGSLRDVEVYSGPIRFGDRELLYSLVHDITGRRRAERALEEREHYLRKILETTADGFWVTDADGRIIDVNDAYCAMSGFPREEVIGRDSGEVSVDETPEDARARIERVTRNGAELFEARHRRRDGTVYPVEVSASHLDLAGGRIVCFGRDISDRVRTEADLRAGEAFNRALIACSPVALLSLDPDGNVRTWNEAAERTFGWSAGEILGRRLPGVPADQRESADLLRQEVLQGRVLTGLEVIRQRKDGTRMIGRLSTAPIRNGNGEITGIIAAIEDITASRELEEQFRQAQKLESVGRLAGGVAHDFNNMLNVILGHAELILEQLPQGAPWREDVVEIRTAARRSADLTRQLLAFARRQTVEPQTLNLNETIESMLRMLRRLIGEDVDLAWRPASRIESVRIDPSQVDQLLANLVVNARDAVGGDGGTVTIETGMAELDAAACANRVGSSPGRFVTLAVSDNGCGMDETTRQQIFEPFFTTKGVGEGTGLGLATVYGIVRQNGGLIEVESTPGQGSTFRIYLPADRAPTQPAEVEPRRERLHTGTGTVLIAEDEDSILNLGARMLERLGYEVLRAASSEEALAFAREHEGTIDLVITDVVMPRMNGHELVRRLRGIRPELKCLYMSGYTADVIARQGVLDPGMHFLPKPFSMEELSVAVRRSLMG